MFGNFKRRAAQQLNSRRTKTQRQSAYQIQTRSSTILAESTISSNSLSTISEESVEMAQPQDIFNTLRIPDVIKDLQTFDGNPKSLPDFVKSVEEVLLFIRNTDNTPYGQVLLRAIRNKIIGPASEALNNHLTPLNWDDIKKVITDLYADKREESTLIRELHTIKQYNKSVIEFYNSIIEIQSLLITNLRIKETNQTVRTSKKDLYEELCLNVFLVGLKEPMGATIRAMRPNNLSSALALCQKEETIAIANPFNHNNPYKKSNYYNNRNYDQKPSNSVVPFNKRAYQNPQYYQPPKRFFNNYNNSNNNYNQETRNSNNNNNYPQIKNSNSNMTRQNSNRFRNQFPQPNTLKIEELHHIDNQQQQPEMSQQNTNIDDTQNFQNFASNHQRDT